MKAVKFIFIGILVLLASVFVIGFFLPKSSYVERSIIIERDAQQIFPYINSMKLFQQWSPWAKIDPNTEMTFFGPDSGVGSGMEWKSDDKRVGEGTQTIVESEEDRRVETKLEFGDQSSGMATLTIDEAQGGSRVTWGFSMDFGMNPIMRYIGLMMDDMLGKSYDQGLASLKQLVESGPNIITETIEYSVDGVALNGFLAYPQKAENAPGVLVVHEWWGNNEYAHKRAEMLAELGYVAFALDMYGDGKVTGHPKEANAFMMEVINQQGVAVDRFMAAYKLLQENLHTDANKMAAIGYCFGGAVVLSMARSGVDLDGVVSFHGSLQGLAPIADDVAADILVLNGKDDPFVPAEQVETFKQEMDDANVSYDLVNYPGVVHGFTNPGATAKGEEYGLPLKYDAKADKDSWQRMQEFLKAVFNQG